MSDDNDSPNHRIELRRDDVRVQVRAGGELIADSRRAIALYEAGHGPTWYLPRDDVRMERLERSSHSTHCPFKGDASYYHLRGTARGDNAVWSYEQPIDAVGAIRAHLAFYPDRVDSIRTVEP